MSDDRCAQCGWGLTDSLYFCCVLCQETWHAARNQDPLPDDGWPTPYDQATYA